MFRLIFILLISASLGIYLLFTIIAAIKSGKVQHRFYFSESSRSRMFDERKKHPFHYWATILINVGILIVVAWTAISNLKA